MFTAFTAPLERGPMTLRAFALRCVRALGVVSPREEPVGAPIPTVIKVNPRAAEIANAAREELAAVQAWDDDTAQRAADAFNERNRKAEEQARAEALDVRARYEALRTEVEAWQAPSPEHETLKRVMIDQLTRDWPDFPEFQRLDGPTYKALEVEGLRNRVASYEKGQRAEEEWATRATAWLAALRASLPDGPEDVAEEAPLAAPAKDPVAPKAIRAATPDLLPAELETIRAQLRCLGHGEECQVGMKDAEDDCDCGLVAGRKLLAMVDRLLAVPMSAEVSEIARRDVPRLCAFAAVETVRREQAERVAEHAVQECDRQRKQAEAFAALASRFAGRLGLTGTEVWAELEEIAGEPCEIVPGAPVATKGAGADMSGVG